MATTRTPDAKRLELSVSNFGPIAEGTVELRPFTVFVGPSNTGKSYLATLIYALHRFFQQLPCYRLVRSQSSVPKSDRLGSCAPGKSSPLGKRHCLHL